MNRKLTLVLIMLSIVALGVPSTLALGTYLNGVGSFNTKYPVAASTLGSSCLICHTTTGGGGGASGRNPYGEDFNNSIGTDAGAHNFSAIETNDSDGDGFSNIAEINNKTYPGNASDFPNLTSIVVSPLTPTVTLEGTQLFIATALNQNNIPMPGINITWTVSNVAVGSVFPLTNITGPDGNASTTFTANVTNVGVVFVNATNGSIVGSANVNVADTTLPVIANVTLNTTAPVTGQSILVSVNATDNVAVTNITANGISLVPRGGSLWNGTITALAGINSVNVSASDAAGNVAWNNSTTYTATAPADITPPVIANVTLNTTAPVTGQALLVSVNTTDNVAVAGVTANGISLVPQDGSLWNGTITALVGTNSVNVSASDAAGNVAWNNSTSYTATAPADITPPVIANVTLNTTAPVTDQSILVSVNATDNVAVTSVTANGISLVPRDGSLWNGTITALIGTNSVNVSARDAAGNVAWNNSTSYTSTDGTPPVINSVTMNTASPVIGQNILVTVNSTDNVGVTNVTANNVNLTAQGSNIWNGTIVALVGTHSVNVSSKDAAGNVVFNNATSYTSIPPPVTSFLLTPDTSVALKGTIIDINVMALNGILPQPLFNGMANITIAANNVSAVSAPVNVTFVNGNATIQVNSSVAQFVNVTATNGAITGTTMVEFADMVISLTRGYNLISIPSFANPSDITQALQLVQNNGVQSFNPATGLFLTPTDLQPLFGYWINVTADNQKLGFIADTSVVIVPPTRNLYEGWNLIGVSASRNETESVTPNATFVDLRNGDLPSQWLYSRLTSFDGASPQTFAAGVDLTLDSPPLQQGHGYWLFIKGMANTNKNNVPWAGKLW